MQHAGDILVVDDHSPTVEFIAEALTDEGYTVRTARDAAQAQQALAGRRPDLVLVDLHLPGQPGDLLARDLQNDGLGDVPVILMTADVQIARTMSNVGVAFCLIKPFNLVDLLDCVATHLRHVDGAKTSR